MNFFKKLWNKLKQPHGFWLVLFYVVFVALVAGTITLVLLQKNQTVWHYILYGFSAIALTYFVYTIIYFVPKMRQNIITFLKKHKFTNQLLINYGYRTLVFSVFSFVLNIAFVIFQAVLAIITGSVWYISLAAYYLVLIIMKGNVFHSRKKDSQTEKQAKTYRFCGIMFLLLTVAFSGIIVLIYKSNMYFEYAGLMIYVVATYTFYNITISIYNLFKANKQDDLYIQSIRNINLASSLVSIMVLQVAMFQAFSPQNNTSIANGLTGGAVSAVILTLGIIMIVKSTKKLKNIKQNKTGDKNEKQ